MSKYEQKIEYILKKEKIKYEKEKTFSDLRGGRYRFDFFFFYRGKPVAVEMQGQQHFQQIKQFHKTRKDFLSAQERDRRKISYCLANDISIYCIPYWAIDDIATLSSILSPKWKATNRYFNDFLWERYQKNEDE